MNRTRGLGRGLGALIPDGGTSGATLREVPVDALVPNPRQPRGYFDPAALEELAQSLRQIGMLQPLLVRARADGRYDVVAGERRLRAARMARMATVPVVVRRTDDTALLTEALVENIHRSDLTPLEEAAAYEQLLSDFGVTHEELAARLGKSRSAITNTLRLLGLAPAVQRRLAEGGISAGHARALLAIDDPGRQEQIAGRVVAEQLSVRATEALVRDALVATDPEHEAARLARQADRRAGSPFRGLEERLGDALATRVRITGSARRGRVVIDYAGQEDLERLLDVVGRGTGQDLTAEG